MYRILLDSSNILLAIGVAKEGKLIDKIEYEAWQRQSETMVKELDTLFTRNQITREDIDSVVVSIGPGSYTGVRIALTIAKTMAFALNIPLYAVSALQILEGAQEPSICLLNARSARSYFAVYENRKAIIADTIYTNEEVKKYIEEHPTYHVCGEVAYLGLTSSTQDILEEMLSISKEMEPVKDILGLTPVYLKD